MNALSIELQTGVITATIDGNVVSNPPSLSIANDILALSLAITNSSVDVTAAELAGGWSSVGVRLVAASGNDVAASSYKSKSGRVMALLKIDIELQRSLLDSLLDGSTRAPATLSIEYWNANSIKRAYSLPCTVNTQAAMGSTQSLTPAQQAQERANVGDIEMVTAPNAGVDGCFYESNSLVDVRISPDYTDRKLIVTPALSHEGVAVEEASVWVANGLYNMYYTAGAKYIAYASCPYTSDPTVPSNWTKAASPVLGFGVGGEANSLGHSGVFVENGTIYLYYGDKTTNDCKLATAPIATPLVLIPVGVQVSRPSGTGTIGNQFVLNDSGTYRLFLEVAIPAVTGSWQTYCYTSSSPTGPWTNQYQVLSLQPILNNTVSGVWIGKEGSTWVAYYHSSDANIGPTLMYRATATTLASDSWMLTNNGLPIARRAARYEIDQVGDPWVFTGPSGTKFCVWEGVANASGEQYIYCSRLLTTKKKWENGAWVQAEPSGATLPRPAQIPWNQSWNATMISPKVVQGTWAKAFDATCFNNAVYANSTSVQNDAIAWPVLMAPGTWKLEVVYNTSPDGAIIEPGFDFAAEATYFSSGPFASVDTYAASGVKNVSTVLTTITIKGIEPQVRNMRFRANARNASNTTGWKLNLVGWSLWRTGGS